MQKKPLIALLFIFALAFTACKQGSFKKTKSGLTYQLFAQGNSKDSLIKNGWAAKFEIIQKLNDSVLYDSHGKMPGYIRADNTQNGEYSLGEILPLMRVGDSAVVVQFIDTLVKRGASFQFNVKKGDRIINHIKILEVFKADSLAQADYVKEQKKDMPRRVKEQVEMVAKQRKAELEQFKKSGDYDRGIQEVEAYLKKKNITAQKTESGIYYTLQQVGDGKQVTSGSFANVKYSGRLLTNDSTFESNVYPLQVGVGSVITGWDEGLQVFKKGSKGTIYIPGYLAYTNQPGPGGKTFLPLIFDIEILDVSDEPIQQQPEIVPKN